MEPSTRTAISKDRASRSPRSKGKKKHIKHNYVGNYRLSSQIGSGASGVVHVGKHRETGKEVAIKTIDKTKVPEAIAASVYQEIQFIRHLEHPSIVKLYQALEGRTALHIVMEYCPGGDLFDRVQQAGQLSEKDARDYIKQLASALAYLHAQNITHRDIKLENLLLDKDGKLKVTDFGFGAYVSDPTSKLFTACGTVNYVAPEVLFHAGKGYSGFPVDVWSLGVCLFTMVAGFFPYDSSEPTKVPALIKASQRPQYPAWLTNACRDLIEKILDPKVETRLNIQGVLADPWMSMDLPSTVPRRSGSLRSPRSRRRRSRSPSGGDGKTRRRSPSPAPVVPLITKTDTPSQKSSTSSLTASLKDSGAGKTLRSPRQRERGNSVGSKRGNVASQRKLSLEVDSIPSVVVAAQSRSARKVPRIEEPVGKPETATPSKLPVSTAAPIPRTKRHSLSSANSSLLTSPSELSPAGILTLKSKKRPTRSKEMVHTSDEELFADGSWSSSVMSFSSSDDEEDFDHKKHHHHHHHHHHHTAKATGSWSSSSFLSYSGIATEDENETQKTRHRHHRHHHIHHHKNGSWSSSSWTSYTSSNGAHHEHRERRHHHHAHSSSDVPGALMDRSGSQSPRSGHSPRSGYRSLAL